MVDISWFKREIAPLLKEYEIKYKFFEKGDFGDLNQVEFNSQEKGGEIDFWSKDYLNIHFVDYVKGEELLNVFLEPSQDIEKKKMLEKLKKLI